MEENNLLHFLDTPSAHYRRTCDGFEAQHDGDDQSDTSDTDPANTREMLEYLLNQPANKFCADCGTPDPKWAALPFGAFICIKCSGTHRSLGVHISKVISVNLDEWTDKEVNCLAESGGNSVVNARYEAFLPENKKLKQDCSTEERNDFIRKKYQFQQFVCDPQFSCPLPLNSKRAADKHQQQHTGTRHGFGHSFRNSWRRKDSDHKGLKKMTDVGMIEFVGLIKVNIVRGIDLAVRDVMSSDPYVMINLGQQSMKTKVIKNTLNPVWNERLMLSIPDPVPPLKLQVFDKDTFSSDDRMGEAEVDIRPLISATKEHENSTVANPTELYRWSASEDGSGVLSKDSIISIANGKVKQEITLRLQNVERGEVEIEIECVPLSQ
ncbi:probable ADP-ribosylation factor GTPase-activating protein AGD11 isoform X2 [Phragmites australis]|uniref:probable ADP-ribosylation factor GTPase-activating protein AGD11 isoform X2 n=1 Tax=Phragmites australis TaxID=29695 RepID=UPI002D76BAAC|nr:probable ADP-ribosylation factor GTPase-activating protein AGD11 isoform X2 [Phragmites australis]